VTCLGDVALDGFLATLSFFSASDSTADRRFRFDGRVSVGAGSIDALVEREDRLGGITQEWNGRWGKRVCHQHVSHMICTGMAILPLSSNGGKYRLFRDI